LRHAAICFFNLYGSNASFIFSIKFAGLFFPTEHRSVIHLLYPAPCFRKTLLQKIEFGSNPPVPKQTWWSIAEISSGRTDPNNAGNGRKTSSSIAVCFILNLPDFKQSGGGDGFSFLESLKTFFSLSRG